MKLWWYYLTCCMWHRTYWIAFGYKQCRKCYSVYEAD